MIRAFISGHTNLTEIEFEKHYQDLIDIAIKNKHYFIIGNADGGDTMALNYLLKESINPSHITICYYNRYENSKRPIEHYKELGLNVLTGLDDKKFTSYTNRDKYMTLNSDYDIAWVRPLEECKKMYGQGFISTKKSGTQLNLERRKQLKS